MSAALNFPEDQDPHDTQPDPVLGEPNFLLGQWHRDLQKAPAGQDPFPPPARKGTTPIVPPLAGDSDFPGGQTEGAIQSWLAPRDQTTPPGQTLAVTHTGIAGRGANLTDPLLGLLAATVDDLENLRKSLANRYRQLTNEWFDENGENAIGLGLPKDHPQVKVFHALLVAVGGEETFKIVNGKEERVKAYGDGGLEHEAILQLQRQVRKHALWKAWGQSAKGIGEKQFARLLAAIGDPYWNETENRPRVLMSSLWKYCGYDVVNGHAPKKAKGQKVTWSPEARMRVWLISNSCLMQKGHYANVYYEAQKKYVDAKHTEPCGRCSPKGHPPAPAGSDLWQAHKHERALRIMRKTILKDLWRAAKAIHEAEVSLPAMAFTPPESASRAGD